MTIDFSEELWYLRYLDKRKKLPLYYLNMAYIDFGKGFYRCEKINNRVIKVYNTEKGTLISKVEFDVWFKKVNRIRKFFYDVLGV